LIEVEGESGTSDIKVAFNAECENANWWNKLEQSAD
jgi:hypothetical protein